MVHLLRKTQNWINSFLRILLHCQLKDSILTCKMNYVICRTILHLKRLKKLPIFTKCWKNIISQSSRFRTSNSFHVQIYIFMWDIFMWDIFFKNEAYKKWDVLPWAMIARLMRLATCKSTFLISPIKDSENQNKYFFISLIKMMNYTTK